MAQRRLITEFFPGLTLEEDEDGIRMLVLQDVRCPSWVVEQALNADARVIEVPGGYCTDLSALESRFGGSEVEVPTHAIRPGAPGIGYRDLVGKPETPVPGSGFVHLHAHSEFSALDGYSTVAEMVAACVKDDQGALALTDHGICAGHPYLQGETKKAGIKPIFGIEAYLVDDRRDRSDLDYYHLVLWAETDEGLRNLWAMNTEANREGFYGKPRMDWETLDRFSGGVIASTACLRGPICHALLLERPEVATTNIARLLDIFRDRLYVEIGTNQMPEQQLMNQALVDLAKTYSLPLVAAVDSHYPCQEDKAAHRVWLARYNKKKDGVEEDTTLFAGDHDYHLMTGAEVRQALSYLPESVVDEAMASTLAVAERCTAKMMGQADPPVFSRQGGKDADVERLVRICIEGWGRTKGKRTQEEYEARFEREMKLLIDKGFCGYFLMVHDQVAYAKRNGILVGPGRGSGGGSLVAYLMGITEIDPVDADLLFERFMTEGRTALPDFDVDYPSSKREEMAAYAVERWGADKVVRVGTHIRMKNKGVIRDLTRVLEKEIDSPRLWPDMDLLAKVIDGIEASTAGLGMPWDEMWAEHHELLDPWRQKYPTLFGYADKMVGRIKSYGRHAAGFVISPDQSLTDTLPLWYDERSQQLVAEMDMVALEALGLVKFDLLNLRNLDTIQMCVDMVREQEGVEIDVYGWTTEYDDPMVWEQIGLGHTLGIFQIETPANTRIVKDFRPQNIRELADVITIGRPGPKDSGLMAIYMRRRAGLEEVSYPDPRLEQALGDTLGCILYQEQVMAVCMVMAGYTSTEADEVRKILGKKKVALVAEAGQKFITGCVERGLDRSTVTLLWEQMAEFARYSFNKAHAWGYAVLGYWTAWLKFHYPAQFFAALLSTEDKGELPKCINDAKRMGLAVLPPDINESGVGFRVTPAGIRYGLDQIKGVGEAAVRDITAGQPYTSWDDYLERKGRNAHSGVTKTMVRVGAFDTLVPNRRELEAQVDWSTSKEADYCALRDETAVGPNGLPCTFDWLLEPVPVGKRGQPLKAKPLPKKCSRACRQYVPRTAPEGLEPYTPADIRAIEMDLLGVHLSSTPFDAVNPEVLAKCLTAEEMDTVEEGHDYLVLATVSRLRRTKDKYGRDMAFMTLYARNGEVDVVAFSEAWEKYQRDVHTNDMCLALVRKGDRGCNLKVYQPI